MRHTKATFIFSAHDHSSLFADVKLRNCLQDLQLIVKNITILTRKRFLCDQILTKLETINHNYEISHATRPTPYSSDMQTYFIKK